MSFLRTVTVKLDEPTYNKLKHLKSTYGIPLGTLVRAIVRWALDNLNEEQLLEYVKQSELERVSYLLGHVRAVKGEG